MFTMSRFAFLLSLSLFLVVSGMSSGASASPISDNARSSGIQVCADLLTRETQEGWLNNPSLVTSDFVAPGGPQDADNNPFFSVALVQAGGETGTIHVTTTASPSVPSQEKGGFFGKDKSEAKCSLQISETFLYSNACEALSLELSQAGFQSSPLGDYATLMKKIEGSNPYNFFYLTQANQGNNCLVTRRKIRYLQ